MLRCYGTSGAYSTLAKAKAEALRQNDNKALDWHRPYVDADGRETHEAQLTNWQAGDAYAEIILLKLDALMPTKD
jgi:hypothetical protein